MSRFLYACGFSGHGFLQSPAIGEVVRAGNIFKYFAGEALRQLGAFPHQQA